MVVWTKGKGQISYIFLEGEINRTPERIDVKWEEKKGIMNDAKVLGQNNYKVLIKWVMENCASSEFGKYIKSNQ